MVGNHVGVDVQRGGMWRYFSAVVWWVGYLPPYRTFVGIMEGGARYRSRNIMRLCTGILFEYVMYISTFGGVLLCGICMNVIGTIT